MILALVRAHLSFVLVWLMMSPAALAAIVWPVFGGFILLISASSLLPMVVAPQLTRFELLLPVHARVPLLARMITASVIVGVPLLLWMMSLRIQRPELLPIEAVLSVVPVVAMALMLTYLTPGTRRLWSRASLTAEIGLRLTLLVVWSGGVWYLMSPTGALTLYSVAAVGLHFFLVRDVPETLLLTAAIGSTARIPSHETEKSPVANQVISDSRLWRLLVNAKWSNFLFLASATALIVWMTAYGILALFVASNVLQTIDAQRGRLGWLTWLPISHRRRLWLQLAPAVAPLCIGVTLGLGLQAMPLHAFDTISSHGQHTKTPDEWYGSPTRPSLVYWVRAPRHTRPVITSPWGESVLADTITLLGTTRYNPYSTRKSNSERFIDWQFQRASHTVYGRAYTLPEYESLAVAERPALPTRTLRAQLILLSVLATGLLLLIWMTEGLRFHRIRNRVDPDNASMISWFLLIAGLAALLWLDVWRDVELGHVLADAFMLNAIRVLPGSWPLTTLLVMLPVFAAYRLLDWQFARSEVPSTALARATVAHPTTS